MIDLKLPKKSKETMGPVAVESPKEEYPYGLRITISNEIFDRFKDLDSLDTGAYVKIVANGCVVSKRSNKVKGGKQDNSIEIQLEEMDVTETKSEEKMSISEFMAARNKKR